MILSNDYNYSANAFIVWVAIAIVCAIAFNKKIDENLVKDEDGPARLLTSKEEHCSIVGYLRDGGVKYIGQVVPAAGTADAMVDSLWNLLHCRGINTDRIDALVSDGCNKMISWKNSAHKYFEDKAGCPLQQIICIFHQMEKLFERFASVHGFTTSSPVRAPHWKLLIEGNIHKKDIVDFERVRDENLEELLSRMTPDIVKELSQDYRILISLFRLIITGEDLDGVAHQKIGNIVKSRWIMTEARMLRAYVSCQELGKYLQVLVIYLIQILQIDYLLIKLIKYSSTNHYNGTGEVLGG